MKKVLVTGASGFIGSHTISHLLEAGYEVHATYARDRRPGELVQSKGLTWHNLNLFDRAASDALLGSLMPTDMLHFAWYAEPGKFWDAPQNLEWLQASSNLLKSFAKVGGKRFVGAGSCAEYDWTQGTMHESSTPLTPKTLYGSCKSNFLKFAEPLCKEQNISFAWGRLFWLYGPGEDARRLVPYVVTSLLAGEEAQCSDGNQMRDFMYVDDTGRAFAELLKSGKTGAFNIGSGQAVRVSDMVKHIAKLLDKPNLLNLGAKSTPTDEPPLVVADISRLYHEVGFRAQTNLDTGLRQSIAYWQKKLY